MSTHPSIMVVMAIGIGLTHQHSPHHRVQKDVHMYTCIVVMHDCGQSAHQITGEKAAYKKKKSPTGCKVRKCFRQTLNIVVLCTF